MRSDVDPLVSCSDLDDDTPDEQAARAAHLNATIHRLLLARKQNPLLHPTAIVQAESLVYTVAHDWIELLGLLTQNIFNPTLSQYPKYTISSNQHSMHDQAFEIATSPNAARISPFTKLLLLAITVGEAILRQSSGSGSLNTALMCVLGPRSDNDSESATTALDAAAVATFAPWVTQEKLVQMLPLGSPQLSFDEYVALMDVLLRGLSRNMEVTCIVQ